MAEAYPKTELVCIVPALRQPPDEDTLDRIDQFYQMVGRSLTALEVLWCLPPEGAA